MELGEYIHIDEYEKALNKIAELENQIHEMLNQGETPDEIERENGLPQNPPHDLPPKKGWNARATSDMEKRLEEAEERIYMLERANAVFIHDYNNNRNAALEEAAQLFDNLVKSSNWNPADLEFFAVKIRALKEE